MRSEKNVKVKMVAHRSLVAPTEYEITDLVNCASITTCQNSKVFRVGDRATESEAEEIAGDRRWDSTITKAK